MKFEYGLNFEEGGRVQTVLDTEVLDVDPSFPDSRQRGRRK